MGNWTDKGAAGAENHGPSESPPFPPSLAGMCWRDRALTPQSQTTHTSLALAPHPEQEALKCSQATSLTRRGGMFPPLNCPPLQNDFHNYLMLVFTSRSFGQMCFPLRVVGKILL